MATGYKKLDVYNLAYELSLKVHKISLTLPKFETYEEGSQIRRSAKSVCANIVEGYALRKYKNEYLHYLYRAYASCEETGFHLQEIFDSGSLSDAITFKSLQTDYRNLCGKLFNLVQSIERNYQTPNYLKEPPGVYLAEEPKLTDLNLET